MWEQLSPQINEVVISIAIGLVALGAAYISYFLKQAASRLKIETDQIQDRARAQKIRYALDRLEETAERVVFKTEQTVADSLRNAVKEGKMDRSELLVLGQNACEEIIQIMEPEMVQILRTNLGDLQAYVLGVVESQVKKLKKDSKISLPKEL